VKLAVYAFGAWKRNWSFGSRLAANGGSQTDLPDHVPFVDCIVNLGIVHPAGGGVQDGAELDEEEVIEYVGVTVV
jgi:hypothetical protein